VSEHVPSIKLTQPTYVLIGITTPKQMHVGWRLLAIIKLPYDIIRFVLTGKCYVGWVPGGEVVYD